MSSQTRTSIRQEQDTKGLSGKEWGYFPLLGLLNPVAYYLVLFKSYDLLPAQVAQPIQPKKYIGMAISLGGVAMISLGGGQALGAKLPLSGPDQPAHLSLTVHVALPYLHRTRREDRAYDNDRSRPDRLRYRLQRIFRKKQSIKIIHK